MKHLAGLDGDFLFHIEGHPVLDLDAGYVIGLLDADSLVSGCFGEAVIDQPRWFLDGSIGGGSNVIGNGQTSSRVS